MDKKSRLKRFHFFTRTIRFFYDLIAYEDLRYVLRKDRRTVFKLKELHNNRTYNSISNNMLLFSNKKRIVMANMNDFNETMKNGV
jgi:hypothetical protein